MFTDVPELLPACGRFGVEDCGVGVVAGVFGELGAGCAEGVLADRVAWLEPVGEPLGELGVARSERSPQHRRELSGVVGVVTGARRLLDLGEERTCLVRFARRRAGRKRRPEAPRGRVWRGLRARRLDEPVGDAGRALGLAAREVGRQLECAHPDEHPRSAGRLGGGSETRARSLECLLRAAELDEQAGAVGLHRLRLTRRGRAARRKRSPRSKSASERAGPWSG